ncbi:S-methyl-5'-thioadenosine phosphorylase [Candidatus Poribacteria bacterium]|jgi:5'-methylthioadenosine phosphorylase|uniref:Nucleoside phosphorylase domain-containing protein n=1 Tax=marine metagenome TaxID=408172 RepID=A0A382HJG4_9ZZZZ|nr:S-methyl-5'-thioadenosine phosphorylase [Candidatus Poribacteria bacterium]MEC7867108.1 S-methyl-5'-thioadenosine phosphorylase [Candidatus Poribacteria bacterium]MEE3193667.1 S-methyl-5'-thioadenosine phosphorylase [Candidatus Poribacteria bacterium]|tara:strand:+ start:762 stop:1622 length:861 start_codon:yes stop_codon:yes gene_type:complete
MTVGIGIIGGSGFYQMEGLSEVENIEIDTPFGKPSSSLTVGTVEGQRVAFLPRHGDGHLLLPSEINVRANIYALKSIGVKWLISVSAVGSLKEEIEPRHFVIPNQLYDHTKNRTSTFFGEGMVAHVSFAQPFCPILSDLLYENAVKVEACTHLGGTYICMEGPAFSTLAESRLYRQFGFDVIGMTAGPEAKLAREAEISYAILACSTDYDCWHPDHDTVTTEMIIENLVANVEKAKQIVKLTIPSIPKGNEESPAYRALEKSIATNPEIIPDKIKEKLGLIIGRYL